jgi:Flp pilus assembly protein TadB
VILSNFEVLEKGSYLAFLYAAPANAIVLLSLRSAWHDFRWNRALISVIVWGSLASVYATLFVCFGLNIWKIFLLGIPGQIAIFLWFRMYRPVKEKKEELPNE